MRELPAFFQESLGLDPEIQKKIFYSIAILIVLGVIRYLILKVVLRFTAITPVFPAPPE